MSAVQTFMLIMSIITSPPVGVPATTDITIAQYLTEQQCGAMRAVLAKGFKASLVELPDGSSVRVIDSCVEHP